ncbi:MAG: TlpA disulfide reductase family protein [Elusimicrobiota bacterium]|nr:TlpA family protein disulfide reductase [Endomicrobiia bacterium]MDW8165717.1 TlpA disulfide reductase family protein [Elusimicrobiota bacterium]
MKKISIFLIIVMSFVPLYSQTDKFFKYIDFEAPYVTSTDTFRLSSVVGRKLVLLNFWTTWCPYCVAEIPELKELYQKYKDKGLEIVSINISETKSKVENFINSYGIPYRVVLDPQAKIAAKYKVRGIPTNFVIDKNGNIVFVGHNLPDSLFIEKNLSKQQNRRK